MSGPWLCVSDLYYQTGWKCCMMQSGYEIIVTSSCLKKKHSILSGLPNIDEVFQPILYNCSICFWGKRFHDTLNWPVRVQVLLAEDRLSRLLRLEQDWLSELLRLELGMPLAEVLLVVVCETWAVWGWDFTLEAEGVGASWDLTGGWNTSTENLRKKRNLIYWTTPWW